MAEPARAEPSVGWAEAYEPLLYDTCPPFVFLWGGRNAGRSHHVSRIVALKATSQPTRAVCVRWTESSTGSSQRTEIRQAIEEFGAASAWRMPDSGPFRCANGSVILFQGLNATSGLKSLADIDMAWVEEAQFMQNPSWAQFVDTVVRKDGVRIFVTGNARFLTDPAYAWCYEQRDQPHVLWQHTTYRDNPWFTETARRQMELVRRTDPEMHAWEWEGQVRTSSAEATVLSLAWLEASIRGWENWHQDAWREIRPGRQGGLDPSDGGGDGTIFTARSGPVVEHREDLTQPQGLIEKALDRIVALGKVPGIEAVWYDPGAVVGASVASYFHAAPPPFYLYPVAFGGPPWGGDRAYNPARTNKQEFSMVNAQLAWRLRQRYLNTWLRAEGQQVPLAECILTDPSTISGQYGAPTEKAWREQLTQVEWARTPTGAIKIDKAPRDLGSPDTFDSECLAFAEDSQNGLVQLLAASSGGIFD